jgi:tRNA pseudouridine38-40 synthase
MDRAARMLEGAHDFAAFQTTGGSVRTTARVMTESRISTPSADLITYDITGNGFLRYMVRAIVGTLVEVGRGQRAPESLADVLESRDRGQAGPTAPPEGLFLVGVEYGA